MPYRLSTLDSALTFSQKNGPGQNHKRIYRELELNLRIKPKKRLVREKPESLKVPESVNQSWSMDFMPEYISTKLKVWAFKNGIEISYIQPGNPQQNAYVERFNRTVRYDWLNQDLYNSIEEVQEKATRWLWHYNNERPNMALGGITPRQKLAMVA